MSVEGLKPPPAFVKNEWAWSYTLNKLKGKSQLDQHGNPVNYGAAIAIYKHVVAKYGRGVADLPTVAAPTTISRAEILAIDAPAWYVSRGMCWSATDDAQQVMGFDTTTREAREDDKAQIEPLFSVVLTRYADDSTTTLRLPPEPAFWLVRESPAGEAWLRSKMEEALQELDALRGDVRAARTDCEEAEEPMSVAMVGEHTLQCAFFDFLGTLQNIEEAIAELESALAVV